MKVDPRESTEFRAVLLDVLLVEPEALWLLVARGFADKSIDEELVAFCNGLTAEIAGMLSPFEISDTDVDSLNIWRNRGTPA